MNTRALLEDLALLEREALAHHQKGSDYAEGSAKYVEAVVMVTASAGRLRAAIKEIFPLFPRKDSKS